MRTSTLAAITITAAAAAATVGGAQEIPPDTVSTIFVSDSLPGYGAVGGVTADALGYVYVADFRNAVWRLAPDGTLSQFADGLYGASGNAVGPRGYLYQSSFSGNYVARISRTGEAEMWATDGLSGPVGIAVDGGGTAFVANCSGGTISRIDPDGRVSEFARSPMFACPNGITFDDGGDLYVVNFNNTLVIKVTPDGAVSEFATIPGAAGNGHITFARGSFFVTKLRGHQVFRLERDGSSTVLAGTGQPGEDDGPAYAATFTRPNGIAATSGGRELWVNDYTVQPTLAATLGTRGATVVTLRRIRLVTLADVLARIPADAGLDELERSHVAYHEARPFEDTAAEAVGLAYGWMQSGRVPDGVRLLELNAERFSGNANAVFHRGEAYRYTGQPQRAAEQYRKALELQPDHPQAAARLREVGGG